ncbi:hypothetical protein BGX26_002718 [Mortierella sp. AD094]|nr:hypothetical protein BGX26_002718 [Mortierella sp. AD094]
MDFQEFRYGLSHLVIFVCTDPETGYKYTPYTNIIRAFPNVDQILIDNVHIPFMTDPSGALYEPRRLPFYPGRTIQLASSIENHQYHIQDQQLRQRQLANPGPGDPSLDYTPTTFNPASQQLHSKASFDSNEEPTMQQNQHHQHRQENLSQMEPMLSGSGKLTDDKFNGVDMNYHNTNEKTNLLHMKIESLGLRLLLFTLVWIITAAAQLVGLSGAVTGQTGESDVLKQRVAYWATACTILYGASLFFLAQWFTKDLVWHWHSNHVRELWGLQPSLASLSIGLLHIRMPLMIVFTLCLTLMSLTSMVTNFWLTGSTHIAQYITEGPPMNYTLLGLPTWDEDLRFTSTGGVAFESFVSQSGASAAGLVRLTPYDNKYIWSPFLNSSTAATINVTDVLSIAVEPKCTLLSAADLKIAYNQTLEWGLDLNLTISTYNITIPGVRGRLYYWGVQADPYFLGPNSTAPMGVNVYNVMARQTMDYGAPSFMFANPDTPSYVYITNCTVEVQWWNVSGTISSLVPQRLIISSAIKTDEKIAEANVFWIQFITDTYQAGLSGFTQSAQGMYDSISYNLKSPLWMWMMGESYRLSNATGVPSNTIIHPNITNAAWVEIKLGEIIGGTLTPNTVVVAPTNYIGQEIIFTSIISAVTYKIIVGLVVQSALLWIPIFIYISKRKASVFYGDDISRLLNKDSALDS